MFTIEFYLYSALLAAFSWVFYFRLTDAGGILYHPYRWVMDWDYTPGFIKKILSCVSCLSGQVGCWAWLVVRWHDYSLQEHILFITLTIFITNLFTKWNYAE